jgi:uncharacterized protein (TIGR03545 family)
MRLLAYVPNDSRDALEEILRRNPKVRRIERGALSPEALAQEIASADPKHGFVIVDPPRGADELRKLDALCGKKKLPRAVFWTPKKKLDPAWCDAVKEPYHYFHKVRRSYPYVKPGGLAKAVGLAAKTDSLLRWGLLGPMAVATLVIFGGLFLFRDLILRKAAVTGLQAVFGAKSEVEILGSTVAPSLHLADVSVGNARKPMSNLFRFDSMKADVNAGPLFSGRIHAEQLALDGLRFGGERKESAALPGAPAPEPEAPPDPNAPCFEKSLEELLKRLEPPALDDLRTVRKAREIEEESKKRMARYEAMAKDNPFQGRIDGARKSADELKNLKPPASVEEIQKEISALRPDAAAVQKAKADLAAAQGVDLAAETKRIEAAKKDVDDVKKSLDDAKAAVEKAKEIKKVSLLDAPKVAQLLKDLAAAQKALEAAPAKLDKAKTALETAQKDAAAKQQDAAAKLKSADDSLAAARKAVDAGGDASKLGSLGPKLAKAKEDLAKHRADVEAKVKASKDEMDAARKEVEGFRKGVADDLDYMRKAPAELQKAVEEDRAELLKRYDLDQFRAEELVRTLLGEEAEKYVRWALGAYRIAQPYLRRPKQPKPGKTPAEKGYVYTFPVPPEPRQPKVWIKKGTFKGAVSIQGEKGTLEGTATHLSSDPALVGEEGRLELRAVAGPRTFTLVLTISPEGDLKGEISAEGFDLKGGTLKNKYLTADLGQGGAAGAVKLTWTETALKAAGRISFTGLKLQPAPDPKLSFIGDLVKGIDRLDAGFELEAGEKGMGGFTVTCDQAGDLTGKLRGAVTGRVEEAKKKALAGLDGQVAGPKKSAEDAAAQFIGSAPGKADGVAGGLKFDGPDGGAAPLAQVDSLEKLLSGNAKSDELTAALKKDLDAMSAQSAAKKDQNAKDGAAQGAAADAASKTLAGQQGALAGIQEAVKAELDRLKKLK